MDQSKLSTHNSNVIIIPTFIIIIILSFLLGKKEKETETIIEIGSNMHLVILYFILNFR